MSRRKHPILEMENWVNAKYKDGALLQRLAEGSYPPLERTGPIPEKFFQHPAVEAKFAAMKQNETMNSENKQRIPEKYSYYNPLEMVKYMKELADDLLTFPKGTYAIRRGDDHPNEVYFEYPPKFNDGSNVFNIANKFKVHLMFNVKYMNEVLHRLFNELIKNFIEARFPVVFKLLNFNPVTSIAGRAGLPNPLFTEKVTSYHYGTNSEKKSKYGRLAESFIYSPTEIKKYQVAAHFTDPFPNPAAYPVSTETTSTFTLDGTTKDRIIDGNEIKGKVIKERYDMETVFDPVIVFYTNDDPIYTRELLQNLLTIFPDDTTQKWVLPNFYPRANVKINNMIYLANGDYGTKYNKKLSCKYNYFGRDNPGAVCYMDETYKLLNIPPAYQTIQDSCSSLTPEQCNAANRFPLAVSNHKLCKLEKVGNEEQCKPQKTYSQHLLLQDYNSLEELYEAVGQRAVLEGFKAGTENASLPTNYGGRRTRRNKRNIRKTRSKRKNTNKSRQILADKRLTY